MTTALDGGQIAGTADAFRDRLLEGLASSIGERGYRDTTVADIVRHARTSKRTFYEQFASKEDCLIELLRRNNENLIANIRAAVEPEADWQEQIRQAVAAYVDHIESRPAVTLSWIREAPALGAVALAAQPAGHGAPHRHAGRPHRQPGLSAGADCRRYPVRWRSSCSADCAS